MAKPEAAPGFRASGPSHAQSDGLRVGGANDSFEREADRVADTVSAGGRIPGLSLSAMTIGQVQRAPAPPEQAKARDSGLSLEEAFLRTALGRKLARNLSGGAHSEATEEHAFSLRGTVVVGPEAVQAVTSLAAAKGGLPARVPEIALDRVHPGLRVQITYAGSSDRPTQGRVAFSLGASQTRKHEGGHPGPAPHVKPIPVKTLGAREPAHAAHPMAHHEHSGAHSEGKSNREEVAVQRKVDLSTPFVADRSAVEPVLSSPGRPLDPDTRRYMEARIGYDFGKVRVHTDSRAEESARAMGAQAYTAGNSVVFGAGRFAPDTGEGRRLLAHELTHVVQQDRAPARAHPVIHPAPVQVQRAPDEDDKGIGAWLSEKANRLKEAAKEKLKSMAMGLPGFPLFRVIIGKDPITGEKVDRDALNVTKGVMALAPGGEEKFEDLRKSGAIEKAFDWLGVELTRLKFTVEYFEDLAKQAVDAVFHAELGQVRQLFLEPFARLKAFASDVLEKVFEFVVEGVLARLGGLGVLGVLKKAGAAFKRLVKDPMGFLRNLLKALEQGFVQFKDKLMEHLKESLVQWLFGQLKFAMPKSFDPPAIVGLILRVLGLDYPAFRKRLVDMIGEAPVKLLEDSFELVRTMMREGPGAAWDMILKKAEGLVDTMMASVRNWVVTKIVVTAISTLAKLFVPASAVIEAIQGIYTAITYFMEKAKQIAELVGSVLDSVSAIAEGNITAAANKVEESMARSLTQVLGFLAEMIHLGGIAKAIRDAISAVRDRIDKAIVGVMRYLGDKAKELYGRGKAAVASVLEWWKERKPFKVGEEKHEVFLEGSGDNPEVMVASDSPSTLRIFLDNMTDSEPEKAELLKLAAKVKWRKREVTDKDAEGNTGEMNFEQLIARLGKLKSRKVRAPESEIKWKSRRVFGGGTGFTAFLSLQHPVGTTPEKGNEPPIWTDLGYLIDRKHYVKGHLLSQRLGGKGEWENMMPLTNAANQTHFSNAEKAIIETVATGEKLVRYKVDAEYDDSIKRPSSPQKAEARLLNLHWEFAPAVYKNSRWALAEDPKPAQMGKGDVDPKKD